MVLNTRKVYMVYASLGRDFVKIHPIDYSEPLTLRQMPAVKKRNPFVNHFCDLGNNQVHFPGLGRCVILTTGKFVLIHEVGYIPCDWSEIEIASPVLLLDSLL
jgi:hypothetical protein